MYTPKFVKVEKIDWMEKYFGKQEHPNKQIGLPRKFFAHVIIDGSSRLF